jgi:uncharacterized membrane protein (DUF4010 family)
MADPWDLDLLRNFAVALFLGALVGIDRERRASAEPYFGGLRTYVLIALAGAVAQWLGAVAAMPALVLVGLAALALLLSASYLTTNRGEHVLGLTGEIAALVVYLVGAACTAGFPKLGAAIGITTAGLLAFKEPLHRVVRAVGPDDLTAGLKLLFATFVVLPLLPTDAVDPWGVIVPALLWQLVILTSGLSLAGYVAVRWIGERGGQILTGLFGGLLSSTALTLASARQSREEGASADTLGMTVLLAWSVMFVRVLVEVAIVHPPLLRQAAPPMAVMGVLAAVSAAVLGRRGVPAQGAAPVAAVNPFSLWEASKFAALFAVILVMLEIARTWLGPDALYAVAALAGTTDVDAITLSMAGLARDEIPGATAALAIVLATAANTVVKAGTAVIFGSRGLARRVVIAGGLLTAAGLATVLLV